MAHQVQGNNFYAQTANSAAAGYGLRGFGQAVSSNGSSSRSVRSSILYQAPLYCVKAPALLMSKALGLAAQAAVYTSSATWSWLKKPVKSAPEINQDEPASEVAGKLAVAAWRFPWRCVSTGCQGMEKWAVDRVQSLVVPAHDSESDYDLAMAQRLDLIGNKLESAGLWLQWLQENQVNPSMGWAEWFQAQGKGTAAMMLDAESFAIAVQDLRVLCNDSKKMLAIEPKLHQLAAEMSDIAREEFVVPLRAISNERIALLRQGRDAALADLNGLRERRLAEIKEVEELEEQKLLAAPQSSAQPASGWFSRAGGMVLSAASSAASSVGSVASRLSRASSSLMESSIHQVNLLTVSADCKARVFGWCVLSESTGAAVSLARDFSQSGLSAAREIAKRNVAIKLTKLATKIVFEQAFKQIPLILSFTSFGANSMSAGHRYICDLESEFMPDTLLGLQGCNLTDTGFMTQRRMISLALMISTMIAYRQGIAEWRQQRNAARATALLAGAGLDSVLPQPRQLIGNVSSIITSGISLAAGAVGLPIGPNLHQFNKRSVAAMNRIFASEAAVAQQKMPALAAVAPRQPASVAPLYDRALGENPNEMPD